MMLKRMLICAAACALCFALSACGEENSGKYAVKVAAQCENY